jgi:hypothetical protein
MSSMVIPIRLHSYISYTMIILINVMLPVKGSGVNNMIVGVNKTKLRRAVL